MKRKKSKSSMNIHIHRGHEQIGGCITEISTDTTRIFIDMGQNLPGVGEPTTKEQDAKMVAELFSKDTHKHTAVFYTHAHEDHVGLFYHVPESVPQYISEGSKQMLLAKYDLIKKSHEIVHNVSKAISANNGSSKQKKSSDLLNEVIQEDKFKLQRIESFITWERPNPKSVPMPIKVGDISITPFFNCHSIYDSHMFLIEADSKRIWHTGDYREHGYMGKGLVPTLRKYATDIDVLITEGTMLNREDECIHEREVSRKMAGVMSAFKYVVVLASATDIERLAAIKEAANKVHRPYYICSGYMKRTMSIYTRREAKISKGLFEFHPKFFNFDLEKIPAMKQKGFVLITGSNNQVDAEELCSYMDPSEVLLIYSSWDGYYKDSAQVALNPRYKEFRDAFPNVVDIHTSGHADRKTIEKVIDIVKPKEVICIHKEARAEL